MVMAWRAVEGDVLSYGISYVQELVPNEKPILSKLAAGSPIESTMNHFSSKSSIQSIALSDVPIRLYNRK
jgi:hypothetical protein